MNNMEIIYYETIYVSEVIDISPNKAGLFEGSFSWGWEGGGGGGVNIHISRRIYLISM